MISPDISWEEFAAERSYLVFLEIPSDSPEMLIFNVLIFMILIVLLSLSEWGKH